MMHEVGSRKRAAHEYPTSRPGPTRHPTDRRQFLRAAFGTSTLAVAAVASPLAATDAQAYDPGAEESRGRYRETDHVKAFYRTNGYETLKK